MTKTLEELEADFLAAAVAYEAQKAASYTVANAAAVAWAAYRSEKVKQEGTKQ